jgi:2-oxoisovalerate dehydrogenase E1 component alpha subunit
VAAPIDTQRQAPTVQLLAPDGQFQPSESAAEYLPYLERLSENDYRRFYRDMVLVRSFDQEGDHIFPAYREHAIGMIRGIDPLGIIKLLRGVSHGGWNPFDPVVRNFHIYTLVIGSQTLHATGYAMGINLDGKVGTGNPDEDEAVIVYFGDGATSQGDVSEAFVFAASYKTPQVFFLQNNHWAISVPVSTQSRTPLYLRSSGFGIPGVQVDGNDVLASYAVSAKHLDDARAGYGPSMIEALTYRIGAHTSSDDPSKYRSEEELAYWVARDPILRFRAFLENQGVGPSFFASVDEEAADLGEDIRKRTLELGPPPVDVIFDHVYSEAHPLIDEQKEWLAKYEASFGGQP